MTKAQLQKSHDAMARYLISLCRYSDTVWGGRRHPDVEQHYQRALKIIKRAGFKYVRQEDER